MKIFNKFNSVVLLTCSLFPNLLMAQSQDLDAIQPATPPPAAESAPEKTSDEAAKNETSSGAATPETSMTRSAASKAIENKLVLGTALGWISLSGEGGSWNSGFHNQLFLTYALPFSFSGFSTAASFRFLPMDVTPKIDSNSYRGIAEGFMFGGEGRMKWKDGMTIVAAAELGFVKASIDPSDDLDRDPDHGKSGVALTAGGGLDWTLLTKLSVGPRLRVGFGSYSMFELSGALGCYF